MNSDENITRNNLLESYHAIKCHHYGVHHGENDPQFQKSYMSVLCIMFCRLVLKYINLTSTFLPFVADKKGLLNISFP